MSEPIKVNAYRVLTAFSIGEDIWWVLSDDRSALIVKPADTTCVNSEKGWYSIIKPKRISATSISKETVHLIMIHSTGNMTVIKRKLEKDDNNKKDATKI